MPELLPGQKPLRKAWVVSFLRRNPQIQLPTHIFQRRTGNLEQLATFASQEAGVRSPFQNTPLELWDPFDRRGYWPWQLRGQVGWRGSLPSASDAYQNEKGKRIIRLQLRLTEGTVLTSCTITSQRGKRFPKLLANQQTALLWRMSCLTRRPRHPLHNY